MSSRETPLLGDCDPEHGGTSPGNPLLSEKTPAPPHYDDAILVEPNRHTTVKSAVFSLVSTIVGGGALSLPYAIHVCGLVNGLVLLVVIAFLSYISIYLLIAASRQSKGHTYEDLALETFGERARKLTIILLFLLTFCCCVAYMVLVSQLLHAVLGSFVLVETDLGDKLQEIFTRKVLMAMAVVLIFPAALQRKFNSLRFLSFFGLLTMIVLATMMATRSIQARTTGNVDRFGTVGEGMTLFGSFRGMLYGAPVISVSFLCHFNVLPVHAELKKPTRQRMKRMILLTVLTCALLYVVVIVAGYLHFRDKVKENVLNNYSNKDPVLAVGQMCLAMTLIFSFPLLALPCRNALEKLFNMSSAEAQPKWHVNFLETVGILGCALLLAEFIPHIMVLWNVMGATLSVIISYILPSAFYLKAKYDRVGQLNMSMGRCWQAVFLLVFGVVFGVLATYQSIENIIHGQVE